MYPKQWEKLVKKITRRFGFIAKIRGATCSYEDLEQEAWIALLKAEKGFDPNKGVKFITYAYSYIYKELLKFVIKQNKMKTESLDQQLNSHTIDSLINTLSVPSGVSKIDNLEMLNFLKNQLSEDEQSMLKEKFVDGKSNKQLASTRNIAEVTVGKRVVKTLEKLKKIAKYEDCSYN